MKRILIEVAAVALGVFITTPVIAGIPMNPRMQTFILGNSAAIRQNEEFMQIALRDIGEVSCTDFDSLLDLHFREHIVHPETTYEARRDAVAMWIVKAKYDDRACGNSYSRTKLAGFFQSGLIDRFLTGEAVFIFRGGNLSPKSTQSQKSFDF